MIMSDKTKFPLIIKITIGLTFFNSWILFEEFVIDRFGYWQYMPLYKVGYICTYDIVVLVMIVIFVRLICGKKSTN